VSDPPLFGGYEPPADPDPGLSAGRRRTARQAGRIIAGLHPLRHTGLHPAAPTGGAPKGTTAAPFTCGSCAHRVLVGHHTRAYPKCDLFSRSHSEASDCRAWWPACTQYERTP
jgi:hypothetical protein